MTTPCIASVPACGPTVRVKGTSGLSAISPKRSMPGGVLVVEIRCIKLSSTSKDNLKSENLTKKDYKLWMTQET